LKKEDVMIVHGPLAHAAVTSAPTRERQTEPSGTARFGEVLRAGGQVLLAGVQAALGTLPGGETLCAAVREGVSAATRSSTPAGGGSSAQRPTSPGSSASSSSDSSGDLWAMTQQSQEFNLMYLQLQEELSRENRRFSALSNVLKSRHETAQSVISNI
jgi:hypothetical protein